MSLFSLQLALLLLLSPFSTSTSPSLVEATFSPSSPLVSSTQDVKPHGEDEAKYIEEEIEEARRHPSSALSPLLEPGLSEDAENGLRSGGGERRGDGMQENAQSIHPSQVQSDPDQSVNPGEDDDDNAVINETMHTTDTSDGQSTSKELEHEDSQYTTEIQVSTLNSSNRQERKYMDDNTDYGLNYEVQSSAELVADSQNSDQEFNGIGNLTPVRKCCELHQYFSLVTQQCEEAEGDTGFRDIVAELLQTQGPPQSIKHVSGRLQECPGSGMVPSISQASFDTHSVTEEGHLVDYVAQALFDHNHYCLELAAHSGDQLDSGILVAAWCQVWPKEVIARKCCQQVQYFDHAHGECRTIPENHNFTDHESLVRKFFKTDPLVESIQVNPGRLICDGGTPKIVVPDEAFLDTSGQLCEFHTGYCYSSDHYCLENLWAEGDTSQTPVASVCPLDTFHKCCPHNEILTETGCTPSNGEYLSARMIQLLEVMEPTYGFPTENGGELCVHEWITPDDEELRWWISKTGYLSVDTRTDSRDTMQYCVDDYLDPENSIKEVAVMCHQDLEELIHVASASYVSESGTIGKCCPHRYYFNLATKSCVPDDKGLHLEREPQMQAANVSKLEYTSFPECNDPTGFHYYYFELDQNDDYVHLAEDQIVEVVSTDGRCELSRQKFPRGKYCMEYAVNGSDIRPSILMCPVKWEGADIHSEKYGLTGVLLVLSCTALVATAFSIISTRVRRGLVTVKKVNTLAGRILLSYVMSYLVSFLLLAVNMKLEVTEKNAECYVMAYLLIYFLLAAFQWNTSICLESLLLTLRVNISEGKRYLYHSAWSWGVPGLVTSLALTLDLHRHTLPCQVITPKVGVYKCFFSDRDAQMMYLHVPILITLVSNSILLLAARYIRSAKLRRLEMGPGRKRASDVDGGLEVQRQDPNKPAGDRSQTTTSQTPHSSGMRTHQTRNLGSESIRLVLWSGGTWILEVLSFVITQYGNMPRESWYDYLWYLPSSINALRGVGIFFILVLTPENRVKISRWLDKIGLMKLAKRASDGTRSTMNLQSSVGDSRMSESSDVRIRNGRRNMSIATTITQLSSIRSSQSNNDSCSDSSGVSRGAPHPNLAHSISQIRRPSVSSQSSEFEGYELDSEGAMKRRGSVVSSEPDSEVGPTPGTGKRKTSLINLVPALPSVNEEDGFDNLSTLHSDNEDATGHTSDT